MSFCRLARVDASLPKNHWRRSLSMPTTLNPSRAKRLTLSEPIKPAEPVTITVLIKKIAAPRQRENFPARFHSALDETSFRGSGLRAQDDSTPRGQTQPASGLR